MTIAEDARLNIQPCTDQAGTATIISPKSYRWVVLAIAFTTFLISFLDRLAWANANLLASKSLGLPLAELGVFVTAFYIGYVAANAVAGFVTDRIGSRRMLFLALAPLAAATFMFGFTSSFAMGLALQAMMGVFAGADYAAGVKILASWFQPSERGRALGLYLTAPSIGVILANTVFPSALGLVDWRALYWGLGALTAIVALTCLVALTDSPDEMVRNATGMPSTDSGDWRRGFSLVARNRNLVLIAIAGFGANWGTWGFAFWATALMVRGHQLTRVDAGVVTAIFGVAAAVAKPLYGYLSDRLGGKRRSLVIYDLIGFCIMLVVFGQIGSKGAFLLAAPLLGVTAFIYSPLLAALITESVDRSTTATATGVINSVWQLGSAIVPSVVGLVFAATNSFSAAFAVLAAGPLFGTLCMLGVRDTKK